MLGQLKQCISLKEYFRIFVHVTELPHISSRLVIDHSRIRHLFCETLCHAQLSNPTTLLSSSQN